MLYLLHEALYSGHRVATFAPAQVDVLMKMIMMRRRRMMMMIMMNMMMMIWKISHTTLGDYDDGYAMMMIWKISNTALCDGDSYDD